MAEITRAQTEADELAQDLEDIAWRKMLHDNADTAVTPRTMAKIIQRAAAIREASYVRLDDGGWPTSEYTKTCSDAIDEACAEVSTPWLSYPLYLLLFQAWNDVLDWAAHVLGEPTDWSREQEERVNNPEAYKARKAQEHAEMVARAEGRSKKLKG